MKNDVTLVLYKMNDLYQQHLENGAIAELAASIVFDYGRDLIGFDICEGWRLAKIADDAANLEFQRETLKNASKDLLK